MRNLVCIPAQTPPFGETQRVGGNKRDGAARRTLCRGIRPSSALQTVTSRRPKAASANERITVTTLKTKPVSPSDRNPPSKTNRPGGICTLQGEDNNMKKLMAAGLALSAVVAASGKANAYINYPWCIVGDTRGLDCVFASREQCARDGRNRGFGGQCIQNPFYNPALPSVVPSASPVRKPSSVVEGESPVKRAGPGRRKSRH